MGSVGVFRPPLSLADVGDSNDVGGYRIVGLWTSTAMGFDTILYVAQDRLSLAVTLPYITFSLPTQQNFRRGAFVQETYCVPCESHLLPSYLDVL